MVTTLTEVANELNKLFSTVGDVGSSMLSLCPGAPRRSLSSMALFPVIKEKFERIIKKKKL